MIITLCLKTGKHTKDGALRSGSGLCVFIRTDLLLRMDALERAGFELLGDSTMSPILTPTNNTYASINNYKKREPKYLSVSLPQAYTQAM